MAGTVGIDVGGTYTDLYFSGGDGRVERVIKVPSTPKDPSIGLLDALRAAELTPADLDQILHGTTIATNAVIERRGARCALITTRGFRDVLELGRRDRPHMYGLTGIQRPLIPRDCRWEVDERLDYQGNVLVPLRRAPGARARAGAARTRTSTLSWFRCCTPTPIRRTRSEIRDILHEVEPGLGDRHLHAASIREYYEFERTSTAVVQGYLQPLVSRYAKNLLTKLDDWGFDQQTLIMQSNGGVVPVSQLGSRAAFIVRSGPAAGVMAAAELAAEAGYDRIITGDMGGTSFDVAVVIEGKPAIAENTLPRLPHPAAPADDRRAHDRRGRRQHRAHRPRRHPAGRAGKRRRHTRARSAGAAAARSRP